MGMKRQSRHDSVRVVFRRPTWKFFGRHVLWRTRAFPRVLGGIVLTRSLAGERLCQGDDLAPRLGRGGRVEAPGQISVPSGSCRCGVAGNALRERTRRSAIEQWFW